MNNFDTTKYFLGKLCLNKHEYLQTGKSLRTMPTASCSSGRCLECLVARIDKTRKYARYINWLEHPKTSPSVLDLVKAEAARYATENDFFDKEKFYLGRLCPSEHEYLQTGKSLREKGKGECHACHQKRGLERNRSEEGKQYYKQYQEMQAYYRWLENPRISPTVAELVEKQIQKHQKYRDYKDSYRERNRQLFKEHYYKNPEYERSRVRAYKYANPEKVEHWQQKRWDKIANQSDGTITREFLAELFSNSHYCPYCSVYYTKQNPKTLDHLEPIALGGKHSASNVIVCCHACNIKKKDKPLADWLLTLPQDNLEAIAHLIF